jgi:hypothetical protein
MTRLSRQALAALHAEVARPAYDITAARVGIVHLGVGAFHRAHRAVYVDDRLAAGEADWAICGASLRSPETSHALEPQDGLYSVAVRGAEGEALHVVGSLRRLIVAPADPQALLAAMCEPRVRIVTLTVTEKGYCHDPPNCRLDETHPAIRRDLGDPHAPSSAPGFLVEALTRRRGRIGAVHGAELRQLAEQRRDRPQRGHAACGIARPGSRPMGRGRGRVPLDDGRPHRSRDDGRGPRARRRAARRRGRVARPSPSRSRTGWSRTIFRHAGRGSRTAA